MKTKKKPNPKTIKPFEGGTCEIEELKEEPGRYWIRVRFDAQGGAGLQFQMWVDDDVDELKILEDFYIAKNFSDLSKLTALPLAAPKENLN